MIYAAWFVLSVVVGFIAEARGRTGPGFFFLSLLLSPLVAVIVLLLIRNLKQEAMEEARRAEDRKFQQETLAAIARQQQAPAVAQNKPDPSAVADHLSKLAELRAHGVIQEDDYKRQVAEALGGQT
jgi:uncharacterized membrane protein